MSPRTYPFRGSISILVDAMGSFLTACSALAVLWEFMSFACVLRVGFRIDGNLRSCFHKRLHRRSMMTIVKHSAVGVMVMVGRESALSAK